MEWLPAEKYYQASKNGRYTVSAGLCRGKWLFTAWRCNTAMGTPLAYLDSAAQCRAICEADWSASQATVVDPSDSGAMAQEPTHAQPA